MTVPNTPTGPEDEPSPSADPYAVAPYLQLPLRERPPLLPELLIGFLTTVVGALLGVLVAVLWSWLAPRVMLVAAPDAIRYVNPEGDQRAGADSVFALIGLGMGVLTALAAFLLTRGRGGGIAVALGLAAGGLAGSWIGWQLGVAFGPSTDVIANAKHAGMGVQFSAALDLGSKGALLVWPTTAMVVLLALSAAFGKREEDPPPYWIGPQLPPSGVLLDQPHPAGSVEPSGADRPADGDHAVEKPAVEKPAAEQRAAEPPADERGSDATPPVTPPN